MVRPAPSHTALFFQSPFKIALPFQIFPNAFASTHKFVPKHTRIRGGLKIFFFTFFQNPETPPPCQQKEKKETVFLWFPKLVTDLIIV